MSLLFPGKSKCGLCGKTIEDGQDVVGFPAFLQPTHALYAYSDGAFHANCFDHSPDRDTVQALFEKYQSVWDSRPDDLDSPDIIEKWGREAFGEFK